MRGDAETDAKELEELISVTDASGVVVGLSEGETDGELEGVSEVDTETLLDQEVTDEKEFKRLVETEADAESEKTPDILDKGVDVIVLTADLVVV